MQSRISLQLVTTIALATMLVTSAVTSGQNSMRKIRVKPNKVASRIGTAVHWEKNYEQAIVKAAQSNKRVFWYVPRLKETFMDRKKEVDRYMKAGPFSWPNMIRTLNENYVPLIAIPEAAQSESFGLVPYKFVEPGFLIIEPTGEQVMKVDRITTMHQPWLEKLVGVKTATERDPNLVTGWKNFRAGNYANLFASTNFSVAADASVDDKVEHELLMAMAEFRLNQHEKAKARFARIQTNHPEHPLAWKAAAEAQGFGPFVRGFEIHRDVPAAAMSAGVNSAGSAAPKGTYAQPELWERGIDYLLTMQHENGGFFDSDYDFGGTDGLPNVHVAVTSIVGLAFLEALDDPALANDHPRITKSLERIVKFVSDEENMNKQDSDELIWAYLYRQRLFNALLKNERMAIPEVAKAIKSLEAMQTESGAWYHEYNNPFVTASCLWAMSEAKSLGVPIDASAAEAGLASLGRDRFKNGAFSYSTNRNVAENAGNENQAISAAGRMPLCEGALFSFGQSDDAALIRSLNTSFEQHDATMEKARKYDDHTSTYSYGGFFFWYDMHGRCDAIEKVADVETRKKFAAQQRAIILSLPEIDGCFVDSHEIGRCYGTAMALECLRMCDRAEKAE